MLSSQSAEYAVFVGVVSVECSNILKVVHGHNRGEKGRDTSGGYCHAVLAVGGVCGVCEGRSVEYPDILRVGFVHSSRLEVTRQPKTVTDVRLQDTATVLRSVRSMLHPNKKSIMPILRIPASSYQRLRMSWRTMIFGNESPVIERGLFSVTAFSSVERV